MQNPLFKAQVKLAFGHDPHQVLQELEDQGQHAAARNLRRGLGMQNMVTPVANAAGAAAGASANIAGKAVAPATAIGPPVLGAAKHLGKAFLSHPRLVKGTLGAAALLPPIASGFMDEQARSQDQLMSAYQDPGRTLIASLDEFLEKKAEEHAKFADDSLLAVGQKGFAGGIGGGLASSLLDKAFSWIGKGYDKLENAAIDTPKRKAILETLVHSDPVIADAIRRHPDNLRVVQEAFDTMVRFAPNLAKDLNAMRSFLREAVIGGAGVNYATIKNLVETEKTITGHMRPGGK